jgi:hypothetical protein
LFLFRASPSLIPEDAVNRPDSILQGFGATWLYLGAKGRTLSKSLLISRGHLHPVDASVAHIAIWNLIYIPHLEQSLIELYNFLLEHLGSSLLSERRWLHASW